MTPERFTHIVLSALSANPKLAQTTPQSFLAAMMTAAQLGMEPNTPLGQAYLIPYYNSRTKCSECQFQLGYGELFMHQINPGLHNVKKFEYQVFRKMDTE